MKFLTPTQHSYTSRGLQLSYLDWGNTAAPTLLLIHGGLEHGHAWDKVAAALSEKWHVVAPDLRGHGDSDWSTGGAYAIADFIPDIVALVDQLGIDTLSLVGHSLGGNIAIHYAAVYPERIKKLCVIEGLGYSPEARKERDKKSRREQLREWNERARQLALREPRRYASVEDAAERIMQHDPHVDHETALYHASHGLRETADGAFQWKYDYTAKAGGAGDVASAESSGLWRAIECPVLLVYGAESWASNPEIDGRVIHFGLAKVISIEKAGHNVHHHQLAVFLDHLQAFLKL